MASQYVIRVVVDPSNAVTGTRRVKQALDDTGNSADKLRGLIQRAFAITGISFGVREIVKLADTYQNLRNRLGTVTKSTAELNAIQQSLFAISQKTRTGLATTTEVYVRAAAAVQALGKSNAELLTFQENLNKAVALSGANPQEASNALIQLSQGLASGVLRGEELRSVLEQLPIVADLIAKKFGVTRAELKLLGNAGKLDATKVFDAIQDGSLAVGNLNDKFAKLTPTIETALVQGKNALIDFIGRLGDSTGITQGLAEIIITLSNNLKTLADIILTVSIAYALRFVPALIAATAAMIANTGAFFSLAVGAGRFTSLLTLASAATIGWTGALGLLKLAILSIPLLLLAAAITRIITGSGEAEAAQLRYNTQLDQFRTKLGELKGASAEAREAIIADSKRRIQANIAELKSLDGLIAGYSSIGRGSTRLSRGLGALGLAGREVYGRIGIGNAPSEVLAKQEALRTSIKEMEALLNDAENPRKPGKGKGVLSTEGKRQGNVLAEANRDIEKQAQLLSYVNGEREIQNQVMQVQDRLNRDLTASEKEYFTAQFRSLQALQDQNKILEELRSPRDNLARGQAALNALLKSGAINGEEYADSLRNLRIAALEAGRDMSTGLQRGLLQIEDQFGNIAELASTTLVNAFGKAEDAIVEFAKTGKFSFSDFADSVLEDLIRLQVRSAITGPLSNFLGSFDFSSIFSSGAGDNVAGVPLGNLLPGYATGGSFTVGGSGMSDKTPVSFMATRGEQVNITKGGQSGGGTNVQVNIINNASGTKATAKETDNGKGGKTIEVMIDEVTAANIRRSGSESAKALQQKFGAQPQLAMR